MRAGTFHQSKFTSRSIFLANNSSTPQSNAASNVSGVNHRTSNTTPSESPSPRSSYHGPPPASLLLVNLLF